MGNTAIQPSNYKKVEMDQNAELLFCLLNILLFFKVFVDVGVVVANKPPNRSFFDGGIASLPNLLPPVILALLRACNDEKKTRFFFLSEEVQSVKLNASRAIVKVGSKIELSCTVIGEPLSLNITWSKASKLIGLSRRRKIKTKGSRSYFTIRNVMAQDEGEYQCQAR